MAIVTPFSWQVHSDGYHDTAAKDPLGVHCDLFVKPDDPLREDTLPETADYVDSDFHKTQSDEIIQHSTKEWVIFTKTLTQKFSHSSMVNTSLVSLMLPALQQSWLFLIDCSLRDVPSDNS